MVISRSTFIFFVCVGTAYETTYGKDPVWKKYGRNYKGHWAPDTRKTCVVSWCYFSTRLNANWTWIWFVEARHDINGEPLPGMQRRILGVGSQERQSSKTVHFTIQRRNITDKVSTIVIQRGLNRLNEWFISSLGKRVCVKRNTENCSSPSQKPRTTVLYRSISPPETMIIQNIEKSNCQHQNK